MSEASKPQQMPPQVRVPSHIAEADRDTFLVFARQELGRLRPRYSGPDRGTFSETQCAYAEYKAQRRLDAGERV